MSIAFIGIGSNLGEKEKNCLEAIQRIENTFTGKVLSVSSFYNTRPFGYEKQETFLNAAAKIETNLSMRQLFDALKSIEKKMGRKYSFRWGPRLIDLDLLFFDSVVYESADLTVPHPGIQERSFVLQPLAEIEKNLLHPLLKKSVETLLNELGHSAAIEAATV